jgi:hypothetical protein
MSRVASGFLFVIALGFLLLSFIPQSSAAENQNSYRARLQACHNRESARENMRQVTRDTEKGTHDLRPDMQHPIDNGRG